MVQVFWTVQCHPYDDAWSPQESISTTQLLEYLSPPLRLTLFLTSAVEMQWRLLSEKMMFVHCW
jgi:hypothetical protein